ncbi:MAG: SDR family oxidoreductase [Pseudomonadota bacterium]
MDLGLKGGKALVTGGTKGIGRAIANTLADEGCNVAICARNQEEVDAAVADLSGRGVTAYGAVVDVGDGDALKGWIDDSAGALGGIDIVVSNVSGGGAQGEDSWRRHLEYDMLGAVRLVEGSMSHLEASDNGNIVLISTTAALEKFMQAGPYNAIKAALLNYNGALSQDLGAKGIRVNAVSPGPIFIEGGAWDNIKKHMTAFYDSTVAEIPLGRMGSADEVAAQVALLASPRAAFTTGTNVVIDGGLTKRIQF